MAWGRTQEVMRPGPISRVGSSMARPPARSDSGGADGVGPAVPRYRLGKQPRRVDGRTLKLARYLTPSLPAPPTSIAWQAKVPSGDLPLDGNGTLGDCVPAASAHTITVWTANAGQVVVPTQDQVVALYRKLSPQNTGVVILDFLNGWRGGFALGPGANALTAYASVNPAVANELRQSVALFGVCFLGLELPDGIVNSPDPLTTPWAVPPGGAVGPTWAPNPQNGHCVAVFGYDATSVQLATWGSVIPASWEFLAAYCDEAYALLSQQDWIEKRGGAPNGFDLAQLQADLDAIA